MSILKLNYIKYFLVIFLFIFFSCELPIDKEIEKVEKLIWTSSDEYPTEPKCENIVDAKKTWELNFKKDPEIWIMAETPKCVLNLGKILEECSKITGIVVGTNDLAKELVLPGQEARVGLSYALGSIILTAKAYNAITLDGVFNSISDQEGLLAEAREGKNLGYDGKTLIHPNQIDTTNTVFAPTEKEIELASKIIEAYEKAKEEKSGVTTVDGVLVEELHVKQSLALMNKMKIIQNMG